MTDLPTARARVAERIRELAEAAAQAVLRGDHDQGAVAVELKRMEAQDGAG